MTKKFKKLLSKILLPASVLIGFFIDKAEIFKDGSVFWILGFYTGIYFLKLKNE